MPNGIFAHLRSSKPICAAVVGSAVSPAGEDPKSMHGNGMWQVATATKAMVARVAGVSGSRSSRVLFSGLVTLTCTLDSVPPGARRCVFARIRAWARIRSPTETWTARTPARGP